MLDTKIIYKRLLILVKKWPTFEENNQFKNYLKETIINNFQKNKNETDKEKIFILQKELKEKYLLLVSIYNNDISNNVKFFYYF
jgi:hypothetical protein